MRPRCARASSSPSPAARGRSTNERGPPRSPGGAPSPPRARASARRAPPASAGAAAVRGARSHSPAATHVLRGYLEANGGACALYARVPERASLVARIPGTGDGPSLLLLGHTDVVLADPVEWSVPPFSGEVRDGAVLGRGALDMKSQVAAEAVAPASRAREGFKPSGDLILAATADEEVGDAFGLEWLCDAHPDALRCDYAINEGAGDRVQLGGSTFYECTTAEKLTAPFRIFVKGRSGHASMPSIADNALIKAATLIDRIAAFTPEQEVQQEVEAFARAVLGELPATGDIVDRVRALDEITGELVRALLSPT